MRPITLHILTQNSRAILEPTLRSAVALNGRTVVADMGSTDGTQDLARSMGAFVEPVEKPEDFASLRNKLVARTKTDWQMYLDPGEQIISGLEHLKLEGSGWHVSVLQADVLSKEVRVWDKNRLAFANPVYESITDDTAGVLDLVIYRPAGPGVDVRQVLDWKARQPTRTEPVYYEALTHLSENRWDEFLQAADRYFFMNPGRTMATTMLQYYRGLVLSYCRDDAQRAAQDAVKCLADRPLMAEFWCLLGDIYYKEAQYKKAMAFYENGMVLGSRRLKTDLWPLQISKYQEHPARMTESCRTLLKEGAVYVKRSDQVH